jgi:dipeptidase E
MRLYLSSFRLGNKPDAMLALLHGRVRAAVITNAADDRTGADRAAAYKREYDDLTGLGLRPTELDLRDYFGKPAELRSHLAEFDLLWARGGNAFILRRALHMSGADAVIRDLLAADSIVYGGYSAGSDMMTPSLRGVELVDDATNVPDGYAEAIVWDCLGILPYGLLPHYKSDHPESSAMDRCLEYMVDNHLPFVALRDGEALVRDGDRDFVVGRATIRQ